VLLVTALTVKWLMEFYLVVINTRGCLYYFSVNREDAIGGVCGMYKAHDRVLSWDFVNTMTTHWVPQMWGIPGSADSC
jgi:hypothetical protein